MGGLHRPVKTYLLLFRSPRGSEHEGKVEANSIEEARALVEATHPGCQILRLASQDGEEALRLRNPQAANSTTGVGYIQLAKNATTRLLASTLVVSALLFLFVLVWSSGIVIGRFTRFVDYRDPTDPE